MIQKGLDEMNSTIPKWTAETSSNNIIHQYYLLGNERMDEFELLPQTDNYCNSECIRCNTCLRIYESRSCYQICAPCRTCDTAMFSPFAGKFNPGGIPEPT